ncbi:AGE family epimerase/isomerase [Alteromonas sp. P256]|uniref:AGE family epimerase/isomerase n=1 Tax=Alteromonas sp. P256 TaxID=3117399 RepID=UPI002FDF708B
MIQRLLILPILCLLSMALVGCGDANKKTGLILSSELAKSQMLELIDPRLNWAEKNSNFMVQTFDANWQVVPTESVESYSQARQVYLFAKGYDVTQENRYLNAMVESADVMLITMFDDTKVLWHSSINRYNTDKRYGPKEYSTSFAIFAMAHAYRVSKDKRYLEAALKTWMLGDVSVGLTLAREAQQANLTPTFTNTWSINPLMHLFEALLVLYDVTQSPSVWQDIEFIAQFIEDELIQKQGFLAENYVNVNVPLTISEGGYVELGHQVEWAYLLHSAIDKGLDSHFRNVAERLYDYAMKTGWDDQSGSLAARSDYDGNLIVTAPVWWAQAELMRLTAYSVNKNEDLDYSVRIFSKSMAFVVNEYVDQFNGGWLSERQSKRSRIQLNKVIGYHTVGMYDNKVKIQSL